MYNDYVMRDVIRLHSMMRSLRVINAHTYMEATIIRKQLIIMLHLNYIYDYNKSP